MTAERVLFLDRDGTLIAEPEDFQVDRLEKIELMPDVIPALLRLRDEGFRMVMVSNQDGLGTERFPQTDFDTCQNHVIRLLASQGIDFDEVFICPHFEADGCDCRKPRTGLLSRYLAATNIDTERSAVIGDRETDLQLASNIGVTGLRVSAENSWPRIADALCSVGRRATAKRTTRETSIEVAVDLETSDPVDIDSGIGFFDHMLEQIAAHGGFSLTVKCRGDLQVDEHHTVEDTALVLGQALREALGNKRGIERFGFQLPMDESEAQVSLDLSGRPYLVFDGKFPRSSVGDLPTELVPHFFRSLSEALAATLHIRIDGDNAHHMVEACFKARGRALRQAVRVGHGAIPSTKGTLA